MRGRVTQRAYAKLNLTLDVTGVRPDGYHDLESVMQTVSLWDEVDIILSDSREIKVDISRDDLPRDLHNLAGKAAKAFLDYVNLTDVGVSVYITKRIPDRAGMAGGSADAAAVIRGLDKLLGMGLPDDELVRIGAQVGSDVPFCIRGGTALARGRGEVLSDLPALPRCVFALVKPKFSVSTRELFAAIDSVEIARRPDTAEFVRRLSAGDLGGMGGALLNVFEPVLPESQRRVVDDIKSRLYAMGALGAAMTGTGSVVFGLFPPGWEPQGEIAPDFDTFLTSPVKKLV